eukprot:gene23647-biopygen19351
MREHCRMEGARGGRRTHRARVSRARAHVHAASVPQTLGVDAMPGDTCFRRGAPSLASPAIRTLRRALPRSPPLQNW